MNSQFQNIPNKIDYIENGPVCHIEIRRKQWYLTQFCHVKQAFKIILWNAYERTPRRLSSEVTKELIRQSRELVELKNQIAAESGYPLEAYYSLMPKAG